MEKELNLVEILKDCPKGTKLYSPLFGEVEFDRISIERGYPIGVKTKYHGFEVFAWDGRFYDEYSDGECMLFPSKDKRDWSKFVVPKPDLPEGTWVMCSNCDSIPHFNGWYVRKYYSKSRVYCVENKEETFHWKYIIPFDNFDPNNIEECIKKYNYGTKQN